MFLCLPPCLPASLPACLPACLCLLPQVAVNYASSPDKAEEVAAEITKLGGEAITIGCNVAKREELDAMFKTVTDKWGQVDVLVNNAGAFLVFWGGGLGLPTRFGWCAELRQKQAVQPRLFSAYSMVMPGIVEVTQQFAAQACWRLLTRTHGYLVMCCAVCCAVLQASPVTV